MSRLDLSSIPMQGGSDYPEQFNELVDGRSQQRLGEAGGLTQFGVNLVELQPGAGSAHRHWHSREDEFVMVISGELTLVTDEGETIMRAGDCAAFPAGKPNGHHLVNRSWGNGVFLVCGTKDKNDVVTYSDVDMRYDSASDTTSHKDGTPYPPPSRA